MRRRHFLSLLPLPLHALPFYDVSQAHKRSVRGANYFVLRHTRMPAVLLELFNMHCKEQREYYKDDKALTVYAKALCDGVTDYRYCATSGSSLKTVILDNGHGSLEDGVRIFGKKRYTEREYVQRMQPILAAQLRECGLGVMTLGFNQKEYDSCAKGLVLGRVEHFVNTANSVDNVVYLSLHIESGNVRSRSTPFTQAKSLSCYIPATPSERQSASLLLAEYIVKHASKHFEEYQSKRL